MRSPITGDYAYLTNVGDYDVFITFSESESVKEFWVGSPNIGDSSTQQLNLAGELVIGAPSGVPFCETTVKYGVGLTSGTNIVPNYVWLEQRDQNSLTPTFDATNTGIFYIVELWSQDGVIYTDPSDFRYNITDYQDGVVLITYFVGGDIIGTSLLWIYCNDRRSPLPGAPFDVSFSTTPPPAVTNVTFNPAGTQLVLNISMPTDEGDLEGIFDCALVIDSTSILGGVELYQWLGPGAFCFWETNYRLIISLGNNAVPIAGDYFAIYGGIFSGTTTPTSPNLYQTLRIALPARTDEPFVSINVVPVISPCTSVVKIDILASTGTAGRDIRPSIIWSLIDTTLPGAASIQAALSSLREVSIQLPADLFTPDVLYTIQCTFTNHMGITGSGRASFTRVNPETLEFNILGGPNILVNVDSQLSLATEILNPCNISVSKFSFLWLPLDNETKSYVNAFSIDMTAKNLWLPGNSFTYGKNYSFMATYQATFDGNTTINLTDTVFIHVDNRGVIVPVISSGDRIIDKQSGFVLDPTFSLDSSGDPTPFNYTWGCTKQTEPFVGNPCLAKQVNLFLTPRVTIEPNVLAAGNYLFSLLISKGPNKFASTSAYITILDIGEEFPDIIVPVVETASRAIPFVNINEPLALTGSITGSYTGWYWTVEPPLFDMSNFELIPAHFGIVVPPYTLLPAVTYYFTLHSVLDGVSTSSNSSLTSATTFVIAQLYPIAGRCSATPYNITTNPIANSSGLLNLVMYHVTCFEWESHHGADTRSFSFGYVSPLTGRDVISTLDPRIYPQADISVPFGTTTLLILVSGTWGLSTNRVEIYVNTPPLWFPTDPRNSVMPIVLDYITPYSSFGAVEQVIHASLSTLEWMNYQGTWYDESTNTTHPLWNVPLVFTDKELETSFRRIRQLTMNAVLTLSVPTLTRYSVRSMAEIYATLSTPTSSIDQNLIFILQSWPFIWQDQLPSIQLSDQVVSAFLEGIWNQMIAQQYFQYTPGSHTPLAQALTDLLNLIQLALVNGMIADGPARTFAWKDVHTTLSMYSVARFPSETTLNFTGIWVDLGSEVPVVYSQSLTGTRETNVAWGASVSFQNPFLYEQSSEGIASPIAFIQIIKPHTATVFEVTNLKTPIRFTLPTQEMYNPFNRDIDPTDPLGCVYWDSADGYWKDDDVTFHNGLNITSVNLTAYDYCQTTHLTEFSIRYNLLSLPFTGDVSSDPGYGWWIFAAVLATILLLILILAFYLMFYKKEGGKGDADEEFRAPEMVGLNREDVS